MRAQVSILICLLAGGAQAQPIAISDRPANESAQAKVAALSKRTVGYDIKVRFEPEKKTLDLDQRLSWRNDTGAPATEIYLHLYLNAFRNSRSTFMHESGGQLRGDQMPEQGWGLVEVESIRTLDGRELALEFIAPDDGNEDDRTLARLPLGRAVAEGETLTLDLRARAKLPAPFARTGAIERFAMVGQWFPKVAKWQNGRWNLHQFHAHSEFFADFGVYDVSITLPADQVVGATGVLVSKTDNGDGTSTHHYHAADVHDFAWTASPDFLEVNGRSQDVDIRVLVHRDHAGLAARHLEAAKKSVAWFQDRIGDYPFPNLTVVDPAPGADGAHGMEYPTLITAGSSYRLPAGVRSLEHVIHHEFGHNFWYHLVATNEFEESWLDEGINSWTDIRAMSEVFGPFFELGPFSVSYLDFSRIQVVLGPKTDPVLTPSWGFASGSSYGMNSYAKPAILLETLRNLVGAERFDAAIRSYFEAWRFRHPRTDDFIAALEGSLGEDLDWFFDQAVRSTKKLDYAVTRVSAIAVEDEGFGFDHEVATAFASDEPDDDATTPDEEASDEEEVATYRNVIRVERIGEFVFPVELEIRFEDGEVVRESWDGKEKWRRFEYLRPQKVKAATVDPENQVVLDENFTNNSRRRESEHLGINRVSARAVFLLQSIFEWVGF